MSTAMDARARHLLKALVESYIADGQPVGSRQLARDAGLNVSAATVRNVMADLEDEGYLCAPHTSAGRVPTDLGYRFFIDALLHLVPLSVASSQLLLRRIGAHAPDADQVLHAATVVLSELTHMAGFVRVPRRAMRILRHVDFIAMRERQILAILVTDKGEVENRLIHTDRPMGAGELVQAANFFNATFTGKPLHEVTQSLHRELRQSRHEMDLILRSAMELGEDMLEMDQQRMLIEGEFQLLDLPDLAGGERLRELLEAVHRKRDLVNLLDASMLGSGVRIFVGSESGFAPLAGCSLVTAPYVLDGEVAGVLGVIGPMRMPYQDIIPLVDNTARLLGHALSPPS